MHDNMGNPDIRDLKKARRKIEAWISPKNLDNPDLLAGRWATSVLPFLTLSSILSPNPPSSPHHRLVFSFTVQPQHCNRLGTLHGGAAATLFDLCTTLPLLLVSRPGFWQLLGVSRTLNVTYLRPAVVGTRVRFECEIVQVGKRVCTLRGVMRSAEDWEGESGLVLALCEHGKMNIDPGSGGGKL